MLTDDALARLREAAELPDLSGTRYRVLGKLGQGGMGSVYLVADAELPPKIGVHPRPEGSFAHAMPAALRPSAAGATTADDLLGLKWVTGFPAARAAGLPPISAVVPLSPVFVAMLMRPSPGPFSGNDEDSFAGRGAQEVGSRFCPYDRPFRSDRDTEADDLRNGADYREKATT